MFFLLKGIILGFAIAAPVGPMGVLCIRRTLSNGMANGVVTGLGTATADALYGCIAAFGVSVIATFLLDNQSYLRLIGGIFLLYLGYTTFTAKPAESTANQHSEGLLGAYISAFVLTITNPLTIISFAAVFAGLGIGAADSNYLSSAILVLGVFMGSMLWWLTLSKIVNSLRTKFDFKRLKLVNRLSGTIIFGFGIISLLST